MSPDRVTHVIDDLINVSLSLSSLGDPAVRNKNQTRDSELLDFLIERSGSKENVLL
jgi:hypothetical protein